MEPQCLWGEPALSLQKLYLLINLTLSYNVSFKELSYAKTAVKTGNFVYILLEQQLIVLTSALNYLSHS